VRRQRELRRQDRRGRHHREHHAGATVIAQRAAGNAADVEHGARVGRIARVERVGGNELDEGLLNVGGRDDALVRQHAHVAAHPHRWVGAAQQVQRRTLRRGAQAQQAIELRRDEGEARQNRN
jgi:hypothetical protein